MGVTIVVILMLLGGLLGGTTSYMRQNMGNGQKDARTWLQQASISISAAFLVPLFLAIAKSNLLDNVIKSSPSDAFVFFSFCLLAGLTSDRFIQSISDRVLQQAREAQKMAENAEEQTKILLEQVTEPEDGDDVKSLTEDIKINEKEKKVLKALEHPIYKLRSIGGIVNDTGLSRNDVEQILEKLKSEGLVREVPKTQRPGIRWAITSKGLAALEN